MKKHNKDVLKATLFALIAIFIMIGAAGLLFAEHKKKIQEMKLSCSISFLRFAFCGFNDIIHWNNGIAAWCGVRNEPIGYSNTCFSKH